MEIQNGCETWMIPYFKGGYAEQTKLNKVNTLGQQKGIKLMIPSSNGRC